MRTSILLIVTLLFFSGCASRSRVTAQACANPAGTGPAVVCKHCNCLMPADAPPEGVCAVCNCGYANKACIRGKS